VHRRARLSRSRLDLIQAPRWKRSIRELKPFSARTRADFAKILKGFSERDAEHIKNIEAETNHDVKAIEYWLRSKLGKNAEAQRALEFVHFACTSEDINNLSYALMLAGLGARRIRRGGYLRRTDRQDHGRDRHRRLQRAQRGPRGVTRCRPRARLPERRLHRRGYAL
jgi:hypothetical protein